MTMAKIIGGGFPVGAFGGTAEVMSVFDPTSSGTRVTHGGTFNANPITMVAGQEAMAMMTPDEYDRLASLGERARTGLADIIERRGISWQVTGQASLFKLHPHPRQMIDYRSSLPTPSEDAQMAEVYLAMLGRGFILTPELAGALSTPMTEREVDDLLAAADTVFQSLG
jgi:glutamate-1-semialdehyde 2,1-aminomutase